MQVFNQIISDPCLTLPPSQRKFWGAAIEEQLAGIDDNITVNFFGTHRRSQHKYSDCVLSVERKEDGELILEVNDILVILPEFRDKLVGIAIKMIESYKELESAIGFLEKAEIRIDEYSRNGSNGVYTASLSPEALKRNLLKPVSGRTAKRFGEYIDAVLKCPIDPEWSGRIPGREAIALDLLYRLNTFSAEDQLLSPYQTAKERRTQGILALGFLLSSRDIDSLQPIPGHEKAFEQVKQFAYEIRRTQDRFDNYASWLPRRENGEDILFLLDQSIKADLKDRSANLPIDGIIEMQALLAIENIQRRSDLTEVDKREFGSYVALWILPPTEHFSTRLTNILNFELAKFMYPNRFREITTLMHEKFGDHEELRSLKSNVEKQVLRRLPFQPAVYSKSILEILRGDTTDLSDLIRIRVPAEIVEVEGQHFGHAPDVLINIVRRLLVLERNDEHLERSQMSIKSFKGMDAVLAMRIEVPPGINVELQIESDHYRRRGGMLTTFTNLSRTQRNLGGAINGLYPDVPKNQLWGYCDLLEGLSPGPSRVERFIGSTESRLKIIPEPTSQGLIFHEAAPIELGKMKFNARYHRVQNMSYSQKQLSDSMIFQLKYEIMSTDDRLLRSVLTLFDQHNANIVGIKVTYNKKTGTQELTVTGKVNDDADRKIIGELYDIKLPVDNSVSHWFRPYEMILHLDDKPGELRAITELVHENDGYISKLKTKRSKSGVVAVTVQTWLPEKKEFPKVLLDNPNLKTCERLPFRQFGQMEITPGDLLAK